MHILTGKKKVSSRREISFLLGRENAVSKSRYNKIMGGKVENGSGVENISRLD